MASNASIRHPSEWADLSIAILVGTVLFLLLSLLTWGLCCFWGALGLFLGALMLAVTNNHLRSTSRRVTEEADTEVHAALMEASSRLGMDPPESYISGSGAINAHTRGILSPIIVLNEGLVQAMDRGELLFVLGHEMGHIKLNHVALRTMLDPSLMRVPLLLYLPILLFRMLFLRGRLSRSMEYSADRAGLAACEDLTKAVSTMIKLGTGRSVTKEEVRGAVDGSFQIDGERGILGQLLSTHPDLDDRVKELVRSSRS